MLLFFDTETTGKYDFNAPPDTQQQPDLVQLAACLTCDAAEQVHGQINLIVDPAEHFTIPDGMCHGITQALATSVGQPRRTVLSAFNFMCRAASTIVAHNEDFDHAVMLTAYVREGVRHRMDHLVRICTMRAATPVIKLPKPAGWRTRKGDEWKWPTLMEAHQHLCGCAFDGAHNAMQDVTALMAIWRVLRCLKAL